MHHDPSVSLRVKLRPDKPVATKHFERIFTGGAAHGARAFCVRKTKSDKITFSRFNFLPLKKIEKTNFFLILWDICEPFHSCITEPNPTACKNNSFCG